MFSSLILTSDTGSGDMQIVGGWVGNGLDSFVDNIKKGLLEIGNWIVEGFFKLTSPFADYGIKSLIVVCFVVYYCSQDNRAISTGIKWIMIYILYILIRSVVL
jgi:hypothetical protein